MRIVSIIAALVAALVACSSKPSPQPPAPPNADHAVAARIRIAYAEARRGGGIAELAGYAVHGTKHERLLALRGLGRIGGTTAIETLRAALRDPDRDIAAAAAAGIGLAASLDDEDYEVTGALLAAGDHVAVIEALGRASDASAQPALARMLAGPNAEAAAIALGRHGRRKIALGDDARDALANATSHADVEVRYAATWALGREHVANPEDPKPAATAALIARIADDDPETRAQAIAALARRKQVAAAAAAIEARLTDTDWRVAVEAVRALAGEEYDLAVANAGALPRANAHVALEVARRFVGRQVPPDVHGRVEVVLRGLERFDRAMVWRSITGVHPAAIGEVIAAAKAGARRHLQLGLLAEWVRAKGGMIADRRVVLRALLADGDVRVRAAAMGLFGPLWSEGTDADHELAVRTITAAIASKDPILAGSAIEAADEIYELTTQHEALGAALVLRADGERDVELAASLYGVIGNRAIGAGASACKQGLAGHVVLAKAAALCLKKLGEVASPMTDPPPAKPPFVDITQVVGRRVLWKVKTTRGDVTIELLPDVAPWAVATIVMLTRRGFYDGLDFHRVVPDFVVQGGDPTESGWGGPGFMIPAEPAGVRDGPGFVGGGVGIADAGRDSGGSQWFVMHSRAAHLDGRYTWIGRVVDGGKSAEELLVGDEIVKAEVAIEPDL